MTDARPPLAIGCRGPSPLSRLVGDLVEELEAAGVVERLDEPARADRRRGLIVVDGCPSACMSRLVAAQGRAAAASVDLSALGVTQASLPADRRALAAQLGRLLRERPGSGRRSRPRHRKESAPTPTHRVHGVEEYLLALDALASPVVDCGAIAPEAPTLAAHVAAALGLSRAAAGEMLRRLEADGLVRRGARKELFLTARGRRSADAAVRRHRLLECFATQMLGYPVAEAYERAAALRGAFDAEDAARLADALGRPDRCPHGWPLDPTLAREESRALLAVDALADGERATVVRLAERDASALGRLATIGIAPGAELVVRRAGERRLVLDTGGRTVAPGPAAAAVLVRPANAERPAIEAMRR